MARHADDPRPQGRVGELLTLLAPSPGRLEFATRQALICALTTLIAEIYQTPDLALTVYVVFFLNRMDRSSSLAMNGILLLLITVVIGLVIVTTILVVDQPVLRIASMGALSFGFLFLTSASKLRPVGPIIALIVGYGLDLLGTFHAGEIATRALLYAWLFAAIPAGVSMVVNLLVAPPPRRLVEGALAYRLRVSAAALRSADARARVAFNACLEEGLGEIPAWLKLVGVEGTSPARDIAALRSAAEATIAILLVVDLATRDPEPSLPASLRERIGHLLDQMAAILESGGYPVDIGLEEADDEARLPPMPAALLADLRMALSGFAAPETPQIPPSQDAKSPSGFFLPDLFSNPEHIHYALKTTAAAMFCYGLYSLLDWPSIHTCFITCYIVALSTTAEAVEKLTLRILGCLLGACAGIAAIVFLVPSLTSIGALMTVVFAGAFVAAWVAGGSPRIAYAGYQIAFAFFLCVIQGPAPAFDMVTARDRVIGILIGNLVSYAVLVYVWPVSVARRIDPAIGAMLRGLGSLALAANLSVRRSLAAVALAARGAVGRDLALLAYEPHGLRPSPDWVRSRSRTVDDIAALTGPLLVAADRSPEFGGSVARRLSRLANLLGPTSPLANEQLSTAARGAELVSDGGSAALWGLVDGRLTGLEKAIAASIETERTANHGPI